MLGANGGVEQAEFLARTFTTIPSICKDSPDEEKRAPRDEQRLLLEPLRRHDDVDQPGLVLQREEDEPLGGARPLPADDEAGNEDRVAIAGSGAGSSGRQQVMRRDDAESAAFPSASAPSGAR